MFPCAALSCQSLTRFSSRSQTPSSQHQEHIDYDLVESTNPAFGKAVVRVNVYRGHRQTVQYIQPQHHAKLAQAELLVIDEAAAIPLPLVKAMLGPYLVFLCSTGEIVYCRRYCRNCTAT
jgi:tRNA(Met) C34 N-acetyltransferase TmcA